jgi:integrase
MSVRKRKWKTAKGEQQREAWVVDYTDADGDRVLRTFDKKRDADAFHATAKVEVDRATTSHRARARPLPRRARGGSSVSRLTAASGPPSCSMAST